NLFQYLFGSILTVTRSDLAVIASLATAGLAVIAVLYRPLAGTVVDEEGARVAGVPIGALNIVVAALAAGTVALSVPVVRVLLVAAFLARPVIEGGRIAWSMRLAFFLAGAVGLGPARAGVTISYYAKLPPGGTIVLVAAGMFPINAAVGSPGRR